MLNAGGVYENTKSKSILMSIHFHTLPTMENMDCFLTLKDLHMPFRTKALVDDESHVRVDDACMADCFRISSGLGERAPQGEMMSLFLGRRDPYTEVGIRRMPCFRCGRPAVHQWQLCANGNRYLPICTECDIRLNRLVLQFMKHPFRRKLMEKYRNKMEES